jgi:hypothetical protein
VMIASIVHGRACTILAARVPWVRAWTLIRVTAARAARVVHVLTRSVVASIHTSSPAVSTHTADVRAAPRIGAVRALVVRVRCPARAGLTVPMRGIPSWVTFPAVRVVQVAAALRPRHTVVITMRMPVRAIR